MPQRSGKAKDTEALDGARFVRPGFAYRPEDDLAFALGYPHEAASGFRIEAVLEELEAYRKDEFHVWNRPVVQIIRRDVGFALLRCPAAVAAGLRARLEKVHARAKAARKKDRPRQLEEALDVLLHGAAGAERSGHRYEGSVQAFDLRQVHDDLAYVQAQVERHTFDPLWRPWARLAFLGGEPVVKHYAGHWRKIRDTAEVRAFVRDFGKIRSRAVTRAIREIAATPASPAAEDASAWLRDHSRAGR